MHGATTVQTVSAHFCRESTCAVCGVAGDVKDRAGAGVSEVSDFLTASMALRRAPALSRLTPAGSTAPFPPYALLHADDKSSSVYSLYSSLLRQLQPHAVLGLSPAAAVAAAAAAAAMVRPPAVFPSPAAAAATSRPGPDPGGPGDGELKPACPGSGAIAPAASSLLNGGAQRYRPYLPPQASLATVAKRLDTAHPAVRLSN